MLASETFTALFFNDIISKHLCYLPYSTVFFLIKNKDLAFKALGAQFSHANIWQRAKQYFCALMFTCTLFTYQSSFLKIAKKKTEI